MKTIRSLAPALAGLLTVVTAHAAASFNLTTSVSTAQTLGAGQTGSISATGTLSVSGATVAITVTGNKATISNSGTVLQTGTGRAIRDNTGVTGLVITNNTGALLQAADADVIQMNKPSASVTLNNYGTMTSLNASAGGAQAVDFNAILSGSNIINNFSTGIMQASQADAVRPGVNGVVNNDGTIKATTITGGSSDGIDAQTNSGITVTNAASAGGGTGTGLIEGARHGITGGNVATDTFGSPVVGNGAYTMTVTNNLGGTIQGDNGSGLNIDGLNANEVVTIVNHGTITGNGHDIGDSASHDGDGVDVDGVVNLLNTGTIKSINAFGFGETEFSEGVTVGGGTITNSGLIQGSVTAGNATAIGRGITIAGVDKLLTTVAGVVTETAIPAQAPYAATTIHNQSGGQIVGDSDSAILFSSPNASGFSHTIANDAGALIQTGSTTAPAILTAADFVTINNAGTIDGSSSGKAVAFGTAGGALNILGGSASVLGSVDGGSGTSTLSFTLGGGTFSYNGGISNFTSVQVNSGTVTYSGVASHPGATVVNGGTFNVTGTLTGTSGVTVNPAGTFIYSNGSVGLDRAVTVSGGTFKYNSAQAYTGALTLATGTVGGSGNLGATALAVGSGVTLAPGDGVGTLATGAQTWASGGNYLWEINALASHGGTQGGTTGWDFDMVTGALTVTATPGGKFTVTLDALGNLVGWDGTANQTWTLATATGGISGFGANDFNVDASTFAGLNALDGGAFSLAVSGNDLNLNFTAAVPEPSTYAAILGALALAGAAWARRRRGV
jgi:hypothetical protein